MDIDDHGAASTALLRRLGDALDLDGDALVAAMPVTRPPLPSTLAVDVLSMASVLVAGTAIGRGIHAPDPIQVAAAY